MFNKHTLVPALVPALVPSAVALVGSDELFSRWTSYSPSFWLWLASPLVVILMFAAHW